MQHIETIELGSSQSSITFSSIPQDGTDLVVLASLRSSQTGSFKWEDGRIKFNGTTTGLERTVVEGNGSSVSTSSTTYANNIWAPGANATSNVFGNTSIYISNYTSSSAKSFSVDTVTENNGSEGFQGIVAVIWDNTSAITSATLEFLVGDIVAGSTASLYKVTAGGDGTVTTS